MRPAKAAIMLPAIREPELTAMGVAVSLEPCSVAEPVGVEWSTAAPLLAPAPTSEPEPELDPSVDVAEASSAVLVVAAAVEKVVARVVVLVSLADSVLVSC